MTIDEIGELIRRSRAQEKRSHYRWGVDKKWRDATLTLWTEYNAAKRFINSLDSVQVKQ